MFFLRMVLFFVSLSQLALGGHPIIQEIKAEKPEEKHSMVDPFCYWWSQAHGEKKTLKDDAYRECFLAHRKHEYCEEQAQHNATSQEEWESHYYKCMNDKTVVQNAEFQSNSQRHEVCTQQAQEGAKGSVSLAPKDAQEQSKDDLYEVTLSNLYYECMGGHE